MIRLFERTDSNFATNGMKVLRPLSAVVKEEINGDFSLELHLPTTESDVFCERIVVAPTPHGDQPFRIYNTVPEIGGITALGRHLFYDLLDAYIEDVRPSGNGAKAIQSVLAGTGFIGESDVEETATAYYQMINPIQAIMGSDNSVLMVWGGELERDGKNVRLMQRLGADKGICIRYRKNLTGLKCNVNYDSVVTRIYPTGRAADNQTLLRLPEKYIDSPRIDSYRYPKAKRLDYPDIKISDEMSEEQALTKLRDAVRADFATGIDLPTVSVDVQFLPLENTEEYKEFASLERIELGDTVKVIHEPLNIVVTQRVMSYEYNALTNRYTTVTLGSVPPVFGGQGSVLGDQIQKVEEESKQADEGIRQEFKAADGVLLSTIENAETGLSTKIEQTEERITMVAQDADSRMSEIELTATGIISRVLNAEGDISTLKVTATGITSRVENAEGSISTLQQTAISLQSSITSMDKTYSSKFTQTAKEISTKVSEGDIASTINQTAQKVKIAASKLELSGYATFSSLSSSGSSTINGDNITTGSLDADLITTGALSADRINGGTIDASKITVKNINASNITTGKLSADCIDTSKLTVDKISINNGKGGVFFEGGTRGLVVNAVNLAYGYITLDGDRTNITGRFFYQDRECVIKSLSINGATYKFLTWSG